MHICICTSAYKPAHTRTLIGMHMHSCALVHIDTHKAGAKSESAYMRICVHTHKAGERERMHVLVYTHTRTHTHKAGGGVGIVCICRNVVLAFSVQLVLHSKSPQTSFPSGFPPL